MTSTLFLLLLHLLPTGTWTKFKDFEGKFQCMIPCATMEHKTQLIKTQVGDMNYHSFYCTPHEGDAENKLFLISYVDYPEGVLPKDSLDLRQKMMDETIESAAKSVNGNLIYQDKIKLKGADGCFWRIDYNKGNAVMKSRAFFVENRFYVVQVATNKARSRNLEADKFLESFSWF
jgi:hypothetical protein